MRVVATDLPEVLIVEPKIFGDDRGFFFESFNQRRWEELTGLHTRFVQDNHSRSLPGVLRGLHYQLERPQGKLIRVVAGEVFDVAVDLRRGSPGFGRWTATTLSAENHRQLWIPEGFAHGFLVTAGPAEVLYKATDFYHPQGERCLAWDDPELAIAWPLEEPPSLSDKDARGLLLADSEVYP